MIKRWRNREVTDSPDFLPPPLSLCAMYHVLLRFLEYLVYDALRIAVSFTLNAGCPDRHRDVLSFVPVVVAKFEGGGRFRIQYYREGQS